jgi:hypothetical protein
VGGGETTTFVAVTIPDCKLAKAGKYLIYRRIMNLLMFGMLAE